jgi:catechol 2,3-dioxygenase-like lactoylglutathione lyase family enzyme
LLLQHTSVNLQKRSVGRLLVLTLHCIKPSRTKGEVSVKENIENMVSQFESGQMSRRQLVGHLTALVALVAAGADSVHAQETKSSNTFEATAIHHIALKVPDLDRSQKFYEQHLGLKTIQAPGVPPFMRLLTCQSQLDCWPKTHLLNLWKAEKAELHHFCFTVDNYDQKKAVEKLRTHNLNPELRGNSAYFRDPDGFMIQIGARDAD